MLLRPVIVGIGLVANGDPFFIVVADASSGMRAGDIVELDIPVQTISLPAILLATVSTKMVPAL